MKDPISKMIRIQVIALVFLLNALVSEGPWFWIFLILAIIMEIIEISVVAKALF